MHVFLVEDSIEFYMELDKYEVTVPHLVHKMTRPVPVSLGNGCITSAELLAIEGFKALTIYASRPHHDKW